MACESLRVEQVDANILDYEYKQVLEQRLSALMLELPISLSRLCEDFKPEIRLVTDAVLWSSRVYKGASPGQIGINIAYKNYALREVIVHFIVSILLPYIHNRLLGICSSVVIRKLLTKSAAMYEAMCILHYLNFLRNGGHSTPVESYLNLRNWNNDLPTLGTINYESQNRELLWHTFRDALLLLWPAYAAIYEKWKSRGMGEVRKSGEALVCERCNRVAVIPMRTRGCGHIACYWCVASREPAELVRCAVCRREKDSTVPVRGRAL